MERFTLFAAGEGGYSSYRIPTCIALPGGRVVAFCEGRRDSSADWGCIRILARVSEYGGRTFGPARLIASDDPNTLGNPSPVFDRETGRLHLLLNGNLHDGGEAQILRGEASRRVLHMFSDDMGETWSAPVDITKEAMAPGWTWHAVGPCHGAQLSSGRLIVPCNHAVLGEDGTSGPYISGALYSDDHGETWRRSADVGPDTNECSLAELPDGRVLINMRSYAGRNRRAVSESSDGGATWDAPHFDEALVEPVCQGSLLSTQEGRLYFVNPASIKRERLTVRRSDDGGRTWAASLVLHEGPAAYADLAPLPDGALFILFECGDGNAYERIDACILSAL